MKQFFEEYGKIIVTAVVAISLIAVTVALRPVVQNNLNGMVNDWSGSFSNSLTIEGVEVDGNGSGGNGGSSVDISNINVAGVVGDFSTAGNLVNINGTQYRVLAINGTQAKVMSMDDSIKSAYGNGTTATFDDKGTEDTSDDLVGQKYEGSTLDQAMTNYYNSLPSNIHNAIAPQKIKQSMYSRGNPKLLADKVAEIEVGTRYVYALDIDDVFDYLGEGYSYSSLMMMFYNVNTTIPDHYIWLRSANAATSTIAFLVSGRNGFIDTSIYSDNNLNIRPAFVIDLSLLS